MSKNGSPRSNFCASATCDGREAPKIARHFPTAARSFEFPHSLLEFDYPWA